MKKNFFDVNYRRKELTEKFSDRYDDKLELEELQVEYLNYLLYNYGQSYYLQSQIEIEDIVKELTNWFIEKNNVEAEAYNINNVYVIKTIPNSGVAKFLGLSRPTAIVLLKKESYFSFYFMPPEWFDAPQIDKKLEKSSLFSNIFVDNIENFIFENIVEHQVDKTLLDFATKDNYFITNFKPRHQQLFIAEREENEILLVWQKISSLKKLAQNKNLSKNIDWYYLMSDCDSLLLGFEKNGNIVEAFQLENREMKVKKTLRGTITIDNYEWTTSMSSATLFREISPCIALRKEHRIREIAKLNVRNGKSFDYAKFLLSNVKDSISPLTIFLLDYIENSTKATAEYSENEKLDNILQNILNNPQAEELLVFWYNDWNLNPEQSVFIMKMLIEACENKEQLKKLFSLHSEIHTNITKEEKDEFNKILYDIEFVRHLIALDKKAEAEKLLKKDLKKLPNLDTLELLPPDNIDPTGNLGGKFLKVMLLELLANVQDTMLADNTIRDIAILQPLSKRKIYKLTGISNNELLKGKAQIILKILDGSALEANQTKNTIKYNILNSKDLEKIKHQSIQKKGILKTFTKWLSSYKTPDYSTIKKYTDRLSPTKHQEVADIISDLIQLFNLENLEVFVAHGKYAVGIRAFEAEVPFLIIGHEHLDDNSPFRLTYNELKFAMAKEIAFLHFKFARITASDIWQGTMEKGNFVLDAANMLVPFAGGIAVLAKNATKIKGLSNFFEQNENISKLIFKGQQLSDKNGKSLGILTIAGQMLNAIRNNSPNPKSETAKKSELIAISRMMQITADRVGLLVTNDLSSAVRSMLLTSRNLMEHLPYVQKYGLNNFILKKDETGNYFNQNFAVRISSLFSFWLSDDFENIRKNIIQ